MLAVESFKDPDPLGSGFLEVEDVKIQIHLDLCSHIHLDMIVDTSSHNHPALT